ncbi:hypothetical protein LguiB_024260 [Lonicera macranthoides]
MMIDGHGASGSLVWVRVQVQVDEMENWKERVVVDLECKCYRPFLERERAGGERGV